MQGKSPRVQVKEPNSNLNMVTCRLSSCKPECTKYTHVSAYNVCESERQYLENILT